MQRASVNDGGDPNLARLFLDALIAGGRLMPAARDRALRAHRQSGERVFAQRLVPRLCAACKATSEIEIAQLLVLLGGVAAAQGSPSRDVNAGARVRIYHAKGCPSCRGTAYTRRTALAETICIDDGLREAMRMRADGVNVQARARASGMETLAQSGLQKILDGDTTIDEVVRVPRL